MKKILQQLTRLRQALSHAPVAKKNDAHPVRDWFILLGLWTAVLALLVGYSVYLYVRAQDETVDTSSSAAERTSLNRALLQSTVEEYRARAVHFEQIRSAPEPVPDPGYVVETVETEPAPTTLRPTG